MEEDRRQFHRIKYLDGREPKIIIKAKEGAGKECKVVNISERGISITGEEVSGLQAKARIEAKITFSDGESLEIEGEVLRVIDNRAVIHLSKGIPSHIIIKEQVGP